jgi:hypothetical protein
MYRFRCGNRVFERASSVPHGHESLSDLLLYRALGAPVSLNGMRLYSHIVACSHVVRLYRCRTLCTIH